MFLLSKCRRQLCFYCCCFLVSKQRSASNALAFRFGKSKTSISTWFPCPIGFVPSDRQLVRLFSVFFYSSCVLLIWCWASRAAPTFRSRHNAKSRSDYNRLARHVGSKKFIPGLAGSSCAPRCVPFLKVSAGDRRNHISSNQEQKVVMENLRPKWLKGWPLLCVFVRSVLFSRSNHWNHSDLGRLEGRIKTVSRKDTEWKCPKKIEEFQGYRLKVVGLFHLLSDLAVRFGKSGVCVLYTLPVVFIRRIVVGSWCSVFLFFFSLKAMVLICQLVLFKCLRPVNSTSGLSGRCGRWVINKYATFKANGRDVEVELSFLLFGNDCIAYLLKKHYSPKYTFGLRYAVVLNLRKKAA